MVNNYVSGSVVTERELVDVVHEGLLKKQRLNGSRPSTRALGF